MRKEKLINSAHLADRLGVSRGAVSNWLARGVLPKNLKPLDNGPGILPLWPESKVPEIEKWFEPRRKYTQRKALEKRFTLGEAMTNIVEKIITFESGGMTDEQVTGFFQELVNSGMAWKLQGSYGRTAKALIEASRVTLPDEASDG